MQIVDAITKCLKEKCLDASPIGALRLGGNPGLWDWMALQKSPEDARAGVWMAYEKGLVEKGPDGRLRVKDGPPIRLFQCRDERWWGAELAYRTGPPEFAKMLGLCAVNRGMRVVVGHTKVALVDGDGRLIETRTEEDFFRRLNAPYMQPQDRVYGELIWPEIDGVTPMIETEWDEWVGKSRWIKTDYVEPHEYTTRVMATDDKTFVRAVVTVLTFGVDRLWRGRLFRELRRGRWYYWTMGYRVEETAVINRRESPDPEQPSLFGSNWQVNRVPLVLKSIRGKAMEVIWQP
jgi:hypothetical protein